MPSDSSFHPLARTKVACLALLMLTPCVLCTVLYANTYYPLAHPRYFALALERPRYTFLKDWQAAHPGDPLSIGLESTQTLDLNSLPLGIDVPLAHATYPLDQSSLADAVDWLISEGYVTYTPPGPCGYVQTKRRSVTEQGHTIELADRGLHVSCSDIPLGGNCFEESTVTFTYDIYDQLITVKFETGEWLC